MPLYQLKCEDGHVFDVYLPFDRYNEPQTCECGCKAEKYFTSDSIPSFTIQQFEAYESPSTGKTISSYAQRTEDLAESGCIEYDPEMRTDYQARIDDDEKKLDKAVDETVEKEFNAMSAHKRENLENEMKHSTLEYTRT